MSGRYPLEALRSLRKSDEERAQRALADSISRLDAIGRAREAATRAAREHREATADTLAAEVARPLSATRADDAIRSRAWRERRGGELSLLERAVTKARRAETEAEGAVERARDGLASARREREAIERHFASWLEEQRHRAEAREEAESEDRRR